MSIHAERTFVYLTDLASADYDSDNDAHLNPDVSPTGRFAVMVDALRPRYEEDGSMVDTDAIAMEDWTADYHDRHIARVSEFPSEIQAWDFVNTTLGDQ